MEPTVVQTQRDPPSQRPFSRHSRLHHPETSDSTDNENYERRRRPRRRHHHDKSKSSSVSNVSSEKQSSVPQNVDRLSDDTIVDLSHNYNDNMLEGEITPVMDNNNSHTLGNKENNHIQTFENNSDSQRSHPSHDSTEDSNKSDSQAEKSEHGIYRKNKKVNPNRVLSADSGMLNKGSNLTRHLSQLSLVDNLRAEIPPHTRKCNLVYHYATMQLNFSPEIDKFVQSIVSCFT